MKKLIVMMFATCVLGLAGGAWAESSDAAAALATSLATPLMEAPVDASAAPAAAPVVNKGDNAWMFVATAFVILMSIPGLALFYGGLVRSKNVLSVLMQIFAVFSIQHSLDYLWLQPGFYRG